MIKKYRNQSGSIIVSLLIILIVLSGLVYGVMNVANATIARSRQRVFTLQAQYAAESGADTAIAKLNESSGFTGLPGETELLDGERYRVTFEVEVRPGSTAREKFIVATGNVYVPSSESAPTYRRTIEVTAQQSTTTATNSLLSRNIIYLQSGVKSVTARDIYANGYIDLEKNTTDLIAENITVADRNTSSGNCSIDGSGNLIKPPSFSDPAQTRTLIRTAYNNCLTPPGNNSNTSFEVYANQSNIPKVQSTFIPWSYVMSSGYGDAPGGCSDWTSGSSPRRIPSIGNDQRTHYPNEESGVDVNCGTNGDISLGSNEYIITDHVHVRADFCAQNSCEPTFTNPETGEDSLKYVFVEGWINFDRLTTTPGSGPIVFVSYGSDPAINASRCPLGGSIFLGNSGTTSAPSVFFLAANGVCLDRTRFGTTPALGGISGKNIYIATNPGTPFDLGLDPTFPVNEIPVDVAWRAVRFRNI